METAKAIPHRHEIVKLVEATAQTGDILFRRSNAKGPYGLPFMKIVARLTKSKFTHAATLFWTGDKALMVLEVTDIGTMQYRFIDWLDFCIGGDFAVYRMKNITKEQQTALMGYIVEVLYADPEYDFTFKDPNKFYCTESVAWLYRKFGVELMTPKTILEVAGKVRAKVIAVGNYVYGKLTGGKVVLDMNAMFYYVGNTTNGGFMASDRLEAIMPENPMQNALV